MKLIVEIYYYLTRVLADMPYRQVLVSGSSKFRRLISWIVSDSKHYALKEVFYGIRFQTNIKT